tara:strand:+ start:208 stop:408 length:201 start_codon:yes stop_codon:yes gene_type:complete
MEIKDIRKLDTLEIEKLVLDKRIELMEIRFKLQNSENKNTSEINKTKKLIARILTVLREKGENNDG